MGDEEVVSKHDAENLLVVGLEFQWKGIGTKYYISDYDRHHFDGDGAWRICWDGGHQRLPYTSRKMLEFIRSGIFVPTGEYHD